MPRTELDAARFNSIFGDLPKQTKERLWLTITAIERKVDEMKFG